MLEGMYFFYDGWLCKVCEAVGAAYRVTCPEEGSEWILSPGTIFAIMARLPLP